MQRPAALASAVCSLLATAEQPRPTERALAEDGRPIGAEKFVTAAAQLITGPDIRSEPGRRQGRLTRLPYILHAWEPSPAPCARAFHWRCMQGACMCTHLLALYVGR